MNALPPSPRAPAALPWHGAGPVHARGVTHPLTRNELHPTAIAGNGSGHQVNEHFLAAARGIGQLPLVAAVHPPRHHAASRAGRLASAGPGQHMHRPARRDELLDGQAGQVRNQDTETFNIARPA